MCCPISFSRFPLSSFASSLAHPLSTGTRTAVVWICFWISKHALPRVFEEMDSLRSLLVVVARITTYEQPHGKCEYEHPGEYSLTVAPCLLPHTPFFPQNTPTLDEVKSTWRRVATWATTARLPQQFALNEEVNHPRPNLLSII